MAEVDQWREQVWLLLDGLAEPIQVLVIVAAFTLGLSSIRALG